MSESETVSTVNQMDYRWFYGLLQKFYTAPFNKKSDDNTSCGQIMAKNRCLIIKEFGIKNSGESLALDPYSKDASLVGAKITYSSSTDENYNPRTICANVEWLKSTRTIVPMYYPRKVKGGIVSQEITKRFLFEGILDVSSSNAKEYLDRGKNRRTMPAWDTPAEASSQLIYRIFFRSPDMVNTSVKANEGGQKWLARPGDLQNIILTDTLLQLQFCKFLRNDLAKFLDDLITGSTARQVDVIFSESLVKSYQQAEDLVDKLIELSSSGAPVIVINEEPKRVCYTNQFEDSQSLFQALLTNIFQCVIQKTRSKQNGGFGWLNKSDFLDLVAIIGRSDPRCRPLLHIFGSMAVFEKTGTPVSRTAFNILFERFKKEGALTTPQIDQIVSGQQGLSKEPPSLPSVLFSKLFEYDAASDVVSLCQREKSWYELIYKRQGVPDREIFMPEELREHEAEIETYCQKLIKGSKNSIRHLPVKEMRDFSFEYYPLTFVRDISEEGVQRTKVDFRPIIENNQITYTARKYAGMYFLFLPQIDLTDYQTLSFQIRSDGIRKITIEFKYINKWPQYDYVVEPSGVWQDFHVPLNIIPDHHRISIEEIVFKFDVSSFSDTASKSGEYELSSVMLE